VVSHLGASVRRVLTLVPQKLASARKNVHRGNIVRRAGHLLYVEVFDYGDRVVGAASNSPDTPVASANYISQGLSNQKVSGLRARETSRASVISEWTGPAEAGQGSDQGPDRMTGEVSTS